jgi:alkyl-hydroperoxide reductase/thiol specific antioxidant family protein
MLRALEFRWPVAVDLDRLAYRAYGLGRASTRATYFSRYALRDYAARLRGEGRGMRPGRDPRQLGGDFVIAPDGTVAYAHPQAHVADRPPVVALVKELERLAPDA